MNAVRPIQSRVPYDDYRSIAALNISLLKEISTSPLHFQHARLHPKQSKPLTLGTAAHTATLEPERFAADYAIWGRRTDSGKLAPRTGKAWDAFLVDVGGKTVITEDECSLALGMAHAVRNDPIARKYIETGDPEVTLLWDLDGRPCKGRMDWLTRVDGQPVLVGLKSARDVTHYKFAAAAARYGYHLQWAWYFDGFVTATGDTPRLVEIVVESEAPHAVIVYAIPEDVIEQGRDEYRQHLETLERCERLNEWPGPAETEQVLSLPSWVYGTDENVADLELEE